MINAKLQNLYNIKNDIGTAIVNKGGTITESTPFYSYAGQIDNISTGTPQTVFQDSTGAKWALTNAVNLTNVSNNVTSDFNWWQPANATTSDPILNVGTVNANISGNIRIVRVNQVNIAQYSNIVINDTTGAKYVGYNGYDSQTNPTPTGNTTFNRWILNNSATGTVVFANTTIVNAGTFNGPNSTANIFNLALRATSINNNSEFRGVTTNDGFVFAGGTGDQKIRKYFESNLSFSLNTVSGFGGSVYGLKVNNGFVYACGDNDFNLVRKYNESTLGLVASSGSDFGRKHTITTNNGFIYVGGEGSNTIQKYHESNLALVGSTSSYGSLIYSVTTNNGFIYAGGVALTGTNRGVTKFYESNLAFVGANLNTSSTPNYGADILSINVNNGFIYAGGGPLTGTNRGVTKFYEDNLAFVGANLNASSTPNHGGQINTLKTNNGFIYVGGFTNFTVQKFYEDNLAFVNNTSSYGGGVRSIAINNGFIYAGGSTDPTIKKYQEQGLTIEQLSFYNISKIKE
jgi:hypothetical protein